MRSFVRLIHKTILLENLLSVQYIPIINWEKKDKIYLIFLFYKLKKSKIFGEKLG